MANINQYETRLLTVARSTEPYPVDLDEAWRWVGYARKDSALRTLQENFEATTDFSLIIGKSTGGRPAESYFLTVDCFKVFCMMAGTERGKEVRKYYLWIEREYIEMRRAMAGGKDAVTAKMREYRLAYENGAVALSDWRKFLLSLLPAKKHYGKSREERLREADAVIQKNFEITGYRPDWVKAVDVYRQYKQEVSAPISKLEFSRRMEKAGAVCSRRYNVETFDGLKYRDDVLEALKMCKNSRPSSRGIEEE